MKYLNFVGSSHLSARHGLPQTLQRQFSQADDQFKSNFCVGEIKSCPGATYCHDQFLDSFVKLALDQRSETEYQGQVNIVIFGSNDQREISMLPNYLIPGAIEKFKYKVKNFFERMVSFEDSMLIVLSIIIPRQSTKVDLNRIVEDIVR